MNKHVDVIVIGAGFAGLTAARELTQRGRSVTVLEGRDRLGGRTWTDHRLGEDIELGGTWVHNLQPHVWSELTRYGLGTVSSPAPERFLVAGPEGVDEIGLDEGLDLLDAGLGHIVAGARDLMPKPFEPLATGQAVIDVDKLSVADRLATLDGDPRCVAITEAFAATGFQAPADEVGVAHVIRLAALCAWDTALDLEAAATYRIAGGTRALIDHIAADTSADIRLETTVASVEESDGGVVVTTTSGDIVTASAVIVTVPINALPAITFAPELPYVQRTVRTTPPSRSTTAMRSRQRCAAGSRTWRCSRSRGTTGPPTSSPARRGPICAPASSPRASLPSETCRAP